MTTAYLISIIIWFYPSIGTDIERIKGRSHSLENETNTNKKESKEMNQKLQENYIQLAGLLWNVMKTVHCV